MYAHNEEDVVLKYVQTGKKLKAKVGDLSREDQQPLKEKDLTKGSNLVVTTNGTDYPVSSCGFCFKCHTRAKISSEVSCDQQTYNS